MSIACLQDGRFPKVALRWTPPGKKTKGKAKFKVTHAERWNVKFRSFILAKKRAKWEV